MDTIAEIMRRDRYVLRSGMREYVGPTGVVDNIEEAYRVMREALPNHHMLYIRDQLTGKRMYFKRDGREIKYPVWE